MDYSIYTFGSGVEIGRILHALATLCAHDKVFFNPVITMSASIGGLWAAVNAIWGNDLGAFFKRYMIPSLLLFNFMFIPKVSVHVIDHVDSLHEMEKVDNVPVGVALVAHFASNLSYYITEAIEENLAPAGDYKDISYGKTGPMFAAYLMGASRDLVVADPTLRENVKGYVDQCFVWPYLYTNIKGLRDEALRTNDIFKFMKTNKHPGLGMYWKESGGKSIFLKCGDVPAKLNMEGEKEKALLRLASQVLPGIGSKEPSQAIATMERIGTSAWHAIAKDSSDAHQRVEQQMFINAGREAIDDGLERLGSPRRYPRLISYSATRAEEQQTMGFLITGVMASRQMPQLQGVLFGILLISFTMVVAYTFIPGGLKIWGMWVKMILWVQSWPIFYGMLNCMGLILLNKSSATIQLSYGEGISWLSQNGLADSAWSAYGIVQNLFLAIPFLSWAIISASSHGLVALADRALPLLGRALGQGIVDNTTNFDTTSMHNMHAGNTQLAQQSLGTNINTGSTMNDGRMAVTTDSSGGQTIQEAASKTRYSVDLQSTLQGQYSQQLSQEEQAMRSESTKFSEARTSAIDSSKEFLESFSRGESQIEGLNEAENKSVQESVRQHLSQNERSSKIHSLSDSKNWSFSADIGVSASTPGSVIGANARVGTSAATNATNETLDQQAVDVSKGRDINQDVTSAINASINNQLNNTTDASSRASDTFRANYNEAKSHATEVSAHQSRIDRLHEMGSITEGQGYTFNQAKTDEFLQFTAKADGSNIEAVARKMSDDPIFAASSAKNYLDDHKQVIVKSLEERVGPMNASKVNKAYKGYAKEVDSHKGAINESILERAEQKGVEHGISTKMTQDFSEENKGFKDRIKHTVQEDQPDFSKIEQESKEVRPDIENEQISLKEGFKDKKDSYLATRALKKTVHDD